MTVPTPQPQWHQIVVSYLYAVATNEQKNRRHTMAPGVNDVNDVKVCFGLRFWDRKLATVVDTTPVVSHSRN